MAAWHESDDNRLKELWISDAPTRVIALEFPGRTKNSVIGRAHRLGLPPKDIRRTRDARATTVPRVREKKVAAQKKMPIYVLPPPPSVVTGDGVPLRSLKPHHCRDVIGYRAINSHTNVPLYCGAPKHKHSSFCEYHYKLYCVKPEPRKR